ncbi:MAG TPA: transcription antitermination factor NusB [Gammaproteobacteria bacterium]|nr:transcription antitermination factor NusB [Gammaproteobacteria bacterium]
MSQRKRHQARRLALQALYQWQVTGDDIGDINSQFVAENDSDKYDIDYFRDLFQGVPTHLDELDRELQPLIDRDIERVDLVERAALRLGVYELLHHPEVPFRVVINESVELAKVFGADKGHRYVNGVLDKVSHKVRAVEVKAAR